MYTCRSSTSLKYGLAQYQQITLVFYWCIFMMFFFFDIVVSNVSSFLICTFQVVFNMPHHDLSTYSEGFYFSEPMDYTTYDFTVPYPYIPGTSFGYHCHNRWTNPCFSSLNPNLKIPGVISFFLQLHHASGTLYHLIYRSCLCNTKLKSLLKTYLTVCHMLLCLFSFVLFLI